MIEEEVAVGAFSRASKRIRHQVRNTKAARSGQHTDSRFLAILLSDDSPEDRMACGV